MSIATASQDFAPATDTLANQSFDIRPLTQTFGAEIVGLDLTKPLSDADFKRVHQAHLDYHVIVFRDQRITPQQQIDFSKRFGPLQIHVQKKYQLEGYPPVLIISNIKIKDDPIGLGDAGAYWHSDLSYKEKPSLGSLLHAQELPSEGGDTLFADQHAAYDSLSDEMKARLEGMTAEHSYLVKYEELRAKSPWRPKLTQEQLDEVKPVVHPIVRTHPETGRKALFVSEHFTSRIIGLSDEDSRALLDELFAHSVQAPFLYRHKWQDHDMVFWDNRSVMHLATGTPDHLRRKLFRTTIEGDTPR